MMKLINENKSDAIFCRQVAARFTDMLCNFYLSKNQKIVNNSTTNKVTGQFRADFESFEF
jgi:hypothetical protein